MRRRLLTVLIVVLAVVAGGQQSTSALTVAQGATLGLNAWGSCVGLVALNCEVHYGSSVICREVAANVLIGNCGAYGSVRYTAVGPPPTCAGTGIGEIVVYSPSRGDWTWVNVQMVMTAGVAEIEGAGGFLGREMVVEGQVTLIGGCAGTGAFTGSWQVVDF